VSVSSLRRARAEVGDHMKTYIALFRGLNVGGSNILPMNELVTVLEKIGARNVKTYIQSGNAVFQSEETNASLLPTKISAAIEKSHSFEPRVLLLEFEELEKAVESNPFPEAESEPRALHLYFLEAIPENPDFDTLASIKSNHERFALKDGVFYLHAPEGIGRSKLAAKAEKLLGVSATARNWRTVCKIMEMAQSSS
jgi:uncharacterized protein (DUF1697 family)